MNGILPPADFSSFRNELRMSSRPVLIFLTFASIVLLIATAGLGIYNGGIPIVSLRLSLYILVIFGWLVFTRSDGLCKWLLTAGVLGYLYVTANSWGIPDAIFLYFIPVALGGALIGSGAGLLAAGLATACLVLPVWSGGTAHMNLELIVSLVGIWATFGFVLVIYQPINEVGGWIQRFYTQAVQMVNDATTYRLELNQAMEEMTHMNRQLALANEKQLAFRIMAEEAQKTKAAFVAKVSHEFRTPLNMIIGLVNLMIDSPQIYGRALPRAMVNDLEIIQRNCEHLTSMINDVLALSQAESGKLTLNREYVDIHEIINQALEVISPLVRKKGLATGAEIAPDLALVYCDRTRIRQVLLNLVSNAARFTESGGISISVEDQPAHLLFSVRDTGPGISPEDLERIFDPFDQGSSRQPMRDRGGTGLGLTISKQFIELHGGKIWVESQIGQGATFFFNLPKDISQGPAVSPGRWINSRWSWISRLGKTHYTPEAFKKLRMVLLDPGKRLEELLSAYQDNLEYTLTENLAALIAEVRQAPANLVLANALNLEELAAQVASICEDVKDTPVVGCVFNQPRLPVTSASIARVLVKPIIKSDLIQSIKGLGKPVRHILLVDNDVEINDLYSRMLTSGNSSFKVFSALTGQDALVIMRREPIDLVLLDLTMPGMDGFAVLEQKDLDPALSQIPVIIVSAMDLRENSMQSPFIMATMANGLGLNKLLECAVGVSEIMLKADSQPG
jgi:signal transduction histidine kinase/CheY-like chemotaxis protein